MEYFVSVIIVNYNGEKHLKDCLASLQHVDWPKDKMEIIVFDNGSRDNSIQIIKEINPKTRIIQHPTNIGFAAPHKIAADTAKGEILAFLNNDMRVDPGWVKNGVKRLAPNKGIVCTSSKIMNWKGTKSEFQGGSLQYLGYAEQLTEFSSDPGTDEILFPCGGAMFISKDIFKEVGCFDEDYFAIFEDVDLGWRLWVMGYKVAYCPESIVFHKGHATLDTQSSVKKRYLMHRNALMTIIKNYDEQNLKKILPLALVLGVKRTLLFLRVNKKDFYFWEPDSFDGCNSPNFEDGLIHLVALDDVFDSFKELIKKRELVQKARKRQDSEIFPFFKDPFRNIMGYEQYLWSEVELFGHFGLERIFCCESDYNIRLNEAVFHARKILEKCTVHGYHDLMLHEGLGSDNLSRKFFKNLRENGIIKTLKKMKRYVADHWSL